MSLKTRFLIILSALVFLSCFCLSSGIRQSFVFSCVSDVQSVRGRLIYDSGLSSNGNRIYRVRLLSCSNGYENTASASGVLTIVSKNGFALSCGTEILCKGRFSDSLFIASEVLVTGKTRIQLFRERVICAVEKRIIGSKATEGNVLAMALLLGRTEDYGLPLKDKARSCGCLHVLALSGMHLQTFIFGKKKRERILSFIPVSVFVFFAGPRPSLVRAYLMFILGFQDKRDCIVCAFLIHCLLFPLHVSDLGFIYGYCATAALIFLRPLIIKMMRVFLPERLSEIMSSSLSALLLTCPIQILTEGCWHLSSLFASPFAGFLTKLSMLCGLSGLVLGERSIIAFAENKIAKWLNLLFDFFSGWPDPGLKGYIAIVLLLIVIIAFLKAASRDIVYA